MKTTRISYFLTKDEIALAMQLKRAKLIAERIIKPNLERINATLGQENDAMYLAYAVELVVEKVEGS